MNKSSKQDKLLKLATDPKILSKAVKGSMEKRLKVMKSQLNSQSLDDIRINIKIGCRDDVGTHEANVQIRGEARKQLLQSALSRTDIKYKPMWKGHEAVVWKAGFDDAIDTIEANMRAKFQ